jgi:hypothetical protein
MDLFKLESKFRREMENCFALSLNYRPQQPPTQRTQGSDRQVNETGRWAASQPTLSLQFKAKPEVH